MNAVNLSKSDYAWVDAAKRLIAKRESRGSKVAAALRTPENKIFCGVNIDVEGSSPCSFCAEYAAIGTMVSEGYDRIETITGVGRKQRVLPPCGKCRQLISVFGNPYVIVKNDGQLVKVKISESYPLPIV
jgi:cytidine deaminase